MGLSSKTNSLGFAIDPTEMTDAVFLFSLQWCRPARQSSVRVGYGEIQCQDN